MRHVILSQGYLAGDPACPKCGKVLDGYTHLDGFGPPVPGMSISVCAYCGAMLEFTVQHTWAMAAPDKMRDFEQKEPLKFLIMQLYREAIFQAEA